jgi:general secretion pathway protein L
MSGIVVFLGGDAFSWLQIADGKIVGHGDDFRGPDVVVTAIVPAAGVTYRNASFGGLSPAQALAAARLDAEDVSLGSDRHVAVAGAGDYYVVTGKEAMQAWMLMLAERGLQAIALVPSPSLLPVPVSGFVRAELPHETVLRSASTALAEDGVISLLVVGDQPVANLGQADFEDALVAAVEHPPINLLQGDFAIRANWDAAPGYWRRMAVFAALLVGLTLAIPLAQWTRLSMATAALDRQSATIAAKALGEASGSDDAIERLQDELVDQRGGGAGFLATQAALTKAIESIPGVELSSQSFDPDGTMRAMVRAAGQAEIDALRLAVEKREFSVTEGTPTATQGRAEVEFQMRPQ